MSASEGMRRLSRAIRLVGIFLAVAVGWYGYRAGNWPVVLVGILILAAALLLAWVVAGFGASDSPKDNRPGDEKRG